MNGLTEINQTIGDSVTKGYDLFGDHGRNLPTPHGSGARPMYGDMGKSCRPDPDISSDFYRTGLGTVVEKNPKKTYPHLYAVFLLDSHNTSYFYVRENNTYYWLHCRKDKDDLEVDATNIQLDLFGRPDLSKKFIMDEILNV